MGADPQAGVVEGDHVVQFYEGDADLARTVVAFLAGALRADEVAVVVATPAHRQLFSAGLLADGIDVARAEAEGGLVLLDAVATLDELLVDGVLDRSRFEAVLTPRLLDAGRSGRHVRVYGEMVALLWEQGDVVAALELEDLWNDLAARTSFTLHCAYPVSTVAHPETAAHFERVCRAHTRVVHGAPVPESYEATRCFAGVVDDVRRARRFVQGLVSDWAPQGIVDDCLLLVSELTANAVRHVGSSFTVSLDRVEDGVQISVGDATRRLPQVRQPDVPSPGGRGLLLIDCIATRWGYRVTNGGKLVWAHVRTTSHGRS